MSILSILNFFRFKYFLMFFFFFQAEDGIRDSPVTGVQTCALPISLTFFIVLPFFLKIQYSFVTSMIVATVSTIVAYWLFIMLLGKLDRKSVV